MVHVGHPLLGGCARRQRRRRSSHFRRLLSRSKRSIRLQTKNNQQHLARKRHLANKPESPDQLRRLTPKTRDLPAFPGRKRWEALCSVIKPAKLTTSPSKLVSQGAYAWCVDQTIDLIPSRLLGARTPR